MTGRGIIIAIIVGVVAGIAFGYGLSVYHQYRFWNHR